MLAYIEQEAGNSLAAGDGHFNDTNQDGVDDNGKYITVAKGYWWNMKQSCICPRGTSYASVLFEQCQAKHLSDGCINIVPP